MADSKGKKAKSEEDDGQQQPELVLNIQKLQDLQEDLERINEEATDKVVEIEQKYSEIRRPVYQKRNEIIQGIPDFWLTAFLSHPALCEMLTDADRQVFKYLHLLDVEDFKDVKAGYSISFIFRPNPYFEDTKLVKVFRFSDEGTTSISGTQPRWKDGMDPTNASTQEKEGNKRMFAEESFFKWFTDAQLREDSDGTHDEIAEIIKEDLWPNPLKYFNNDPDDEFDDEDEDEEDDGEFQENGAEGSEDDDDNNDDEDDDEDDPNE